MTHQPATLSPSATPAPLTAWTLGEVARLTGASIEARWSEWPFGPLTSDSRALKPGDYFLALRGERLDGHQFCAAAVAAGAAGLIVDRAFTPAELDGAVLILRVEDTLQAYGDLAAARRRQWAGPLLAISGSAGKTSTRRLVADALRRHFAVLEPIKNYNNLIGVPYTLLGLSAEHRAAVMELGMNQPGELRRLTWIAAPTVALLTQISLTHVGLFDSPEALTEAKLDLFRGCAPGTPLVVNAACPRTMGAREAFADDHPLIYFLGEGEPAAPVTPSVLIQNARPIAPFGYTFDCRLPDGWHRGLTLRMFGRHHLQNVAAAAALLHAAGWPASWALEALDDYHTEPWRGDVIQAGPYTWVLDCYNASPPSMRGALESLKELPCPGRRVLVLADMLELGGYAAPAHEQLLEFLRPLAPALFFGLGEHCSHLARQLAAEGWPAQGFLERKDLIQALVACLQTGDQIFLKGSHGFALEKVAQALAPELKEG